MKKYLSDAAVLVALAIVFALVALSAQALTDNNCVTESDGSSDYCTTPADWECGYYQANYEEEDVPEWCGSAVDVTPTKDYSNVLPVVTSTPPPPPSTSPDDNPYPPPALGQ